MNMQEFFNGISNFGFPVVVAGYLLFRFEKKIESLTDSLNKLTIEVERLSNKLK